MWSIWAHNFCSSRNKVKGLPCREGLLSFSAYLVGNRFGIGGWGVHSRLRDCRMGLFGKPDVLHG